MNYGQYIKSIEKKQTIMPSIPKNVEIEQLLISRDVKDGNYPNYCQSPNYEVITSKNGSPLCNYCGLPSHKRQNCLIKRDDRKIGLTRINHPDKNKCIQMQIKRNQSQMSNGQ